jgi:hypothetical protein
MYESDVRFTPVENMNPQRKDAECIKCKWMMGTCPRVLKYFTLGMRVGLVLSIQHFTGCNAFSAKKDSEGTRIERNR